MFSHLINFKCDCACVSGIGVRRWTDAVSLCRWLILPGPWTPAVRTSRTQNRPLWPLQHWLLLFTLTLTFVFITCFAHKSYLVKDLWFCPLYFPHVFLCLFYKMMLHMNIRFVFVMLFMTSYSDHRIQIELSALET